MKYATTIKDLLGCQYDRHFIFCFAFFLVAGGGGEGITPLKVLVVDCKGKFFSTAKFLSGLGIRAGIYKSVPLFHISSINVHISLT